MVKQVKTRQSTARNSAEFSRRDFWLAGLGAMSLGRKQGLRLYGQIRQQSRLLPTNASHLVSNLSGQVGEGLGAARGRIIALVEPLRSNVLARVADLSAMANARLQPLLARFGRPTATRQGPTKRATSRKAATRTVRKTAASRQAA